MEITKHTSYYYSEHFRNLFFINRYLDGYISFFRFMTRHYSFADDNHTITYVNNICARIICLCVAYIRQNLRSTVPKINYFVLNH